MGTTMEIWEKRRRNLRAILAVKGLRASAVSKRASLGPNTLGKFLRGETKSLRWATLETICNEIGIANAAVLDADNPFSDTKNRLYELIEAMSDEQAEKELQRLTSPQED